MKAIQNGQAVVLNIEDQTCFVPRKDVYDQTKKPVEYDDSELDVRELEPLLADLAPEDWDDFGRG